ncbi:AMP-binding protein [Pseudonocardia asaccharolytica]|uniref:Acyl-CoA synthetase n=1 Tax=Pseudonocardia asaccharolytica DSM 44247 = NBRC 16224 TaxID=1123024 RepID=A0A511CXF4_9PSEU|nr:AMP-binding protein [Pseudonocardia asaccharolytica]GEL17240.1 acyl-CoA synthetase [Pseudonocardia asaccharolytica DSM 44247 = NBRC 16224]
MLQIHFQFAPEHGLVKESVAVLLSGVAAQVPAAIAVVQGDRSRTYAELDERSARLAAGLSSVGVRNGSRVAIVLHNCIEYLEVVLALGKLGALAVNVNYRYRASELTDLLEGARIDAMIVNPARTPQAVEISASLSSRPVLIGLDPDAGQIGAGMLDYERFLAAHAPITDLGLSVTDRFLLFTGGTTGRPRGVLRDQINLFGTCATSAFLGLELDPPETAAELYRIVDSVNAAKRAPVAIPASPLMHGTGLFHSLGVLLVGGTVVLTAGASFQASEIWQLVERHRVTELAIVGNVFAKPLVEELQRAAEAGQPYDLSSLRRISSSGLVWSANLKDQLLSRADVRLVDVLASTEGGPYAVSVSSREARPETATFQLVPGAGVLTLDGRLLRAGQRGTGLLCAEVPGFACYLDDPERTAHVYRTIDERTMVVPGDVAELHEDGSVRLLGRGSEVINTGGEKVFAEEIEQALCREPRIKDAVVIGADDERWGQCIAAIVSLEPDASMTDAEVVEAVAAQLADYKKPRVVVFVPEIERTPAGKANLVWAKKIIEAA